MDGSNQLMIDLDGNLDLIVLNIINLKNVIKNGVKVEEVLGVLQK